MSRDLEDKIFDTAEDAFEVVWRNAWQFADTVFKLTGWLIMVVAIKALAEVNPTTGLKVAGNALAAVWVLTAIVICTDAAVSAQRIVAGQITGKVHVSRRWDLIVSIGATVIVGGLYLGLLLPAVTTAVESMLVWTTVTQDSQS